MPHIQSRDAATRPPRVFSFSRFETICIIAAAAGLVCAGLALTAHHQRLTYTFLIEQDLVVVTLAATLLLIGLAWPHRLIVPFPAWPAEGLKMRPITLAVAMAGLFGFGIVGHFAIMHGYAFSRDEQMALFDANVFATGQLVGTIPAEWRGLVDAMNTTFLTVPPDGTKWISEYLPVNGLLHAPAASFGLTAIVNPALAAIGLWATWCVGRQIWPDTQETAAIAALLYVTSTQVWAISMTSYAMTGHLALNMIWLMCFMRGGRFGHLAAVLFGFAATGLHQFIFHPLFALPFIALLLSRREWRLVAFYGVAYAAIVLFWICYDKWTIYAGVPPQAHELGGIWGYIERARQLLSEQPPYRAGLMAANLMRFFTWQNLLLLPLLITAYLAVRQRRDPLLRAMFGALVLTPFVMLFLVAYQGHGWGYRYMHGLIGIACLLGSRGWHHLRTRDAAPRNALTVATAATVLLASPYLMWHSNRFISSFAETDRLIGKQDVDIVVVADTETGLASDLATTWPHRTGEPVRLLASRISDDRMDALCARYTIARASNVGRGRTAVIRRACK